MHRLIHLIVAVVIVASGGLIGRSVAAAQPEPQPVTLPCATNISAQVLGNTLPATADGQALVLARIIFGPGGSIGAHTHPGTLVVSVEAGSLGITLLDQDETSVMRAMPAGTPAVAEPMTQDQEVELAPGDWIVETGMILHGTRNLSEEPTSVLLTGLIEAGQPLTLCAEGTPTP
ncbi:MAG: hypothetical protein M3464_20125 [Chloroflexota bacterium]|nr:hypothetical protein [Chloroflexota bacterium]